MVGVVSNQDVVPAGQRILNGPGDSDVEWHILLDRLYRTEWHHRTLANQVLSDHDDTHSGAARWCNVESCRLASAYLHR